MDFHRALFILRLWELQEGNMNSLLHIRRENRLPATTQEDRKTPYLLQADYTAMPGSAQSNKMYSGSELICEARCSTGERNEDLSISMFPQFKESDGFIMMVDPETLEEQCTIGFRNSI